MPDEKLVKYFEKYLKKGYSKEQLHDYLKDKHSNQEIDEAYQIAKQSMKVDEKSLKRPKLIHDIVVLGFIGYVINIAFFLFAYFYNPEIFYKMVFPYLNVISIIFLIIIPIMLVGLYKLKRWGLYLGIIISISMIALGLYQTEIVSIGFYIIFLIFLFRSRERFQS